MCSPVFFCFFLFCEKIFAPSYAGIVARPRGLLVLRLPVQRGPEKSIMPGWVLINGRGGCSRDLSVDAFSCWFRGGRVCVVVLLDDVAKKLRSIKEDMLFAAHAVDAGVADPNNVVHQSKVCWYHTVVARRPKRKIGLFCGSASCAGRRDRFGCFSI